MEIGSTDDNEESDSTSTDESRTSPIKVRRLMTRRQYLASMEIPPSGTVHVIPDIPDLGQPVWAAPPHACGHQGQQAWAAPQHGLQPQQALAGSQHQQGGDFAPDEFAGKAEGMAADVPSPVGPDYTHDFGDYFVRMESQFDIIRGEIGQLSNAVRTLAAELQQMRLAHSTHMDDHACILQEILGYLRRSSSQPPS